MTPKDLARVLACRNHPNVRDFMLSQRDINAEEHRQWFEQCVQTGSKQLLIFEAGGDAMGFVSFSAPDPGGTLGNNQRSIRCHQRLGFTQEGVLRDQHFGAGRYYDILCFGLSRAEWQS